MGCAKLEPSPLNRLSLYMIRDTGQRERETRLKLTEFFFRIMAVTELGGGALANERYLTEGAQAE